MSQSILKAIALVIALYTGVVYPAGRDVATCTNACGGQNVSCRGMNATCGGGDDGGGLLNAFKSRVDWGSTQKIKTDSIGRIVKDIQYEVKFPSKGQKKIISFIPSKGNAMNKRIEVLFVSFDLQTKKFPENTPSEIMQEIQKRDSNMFNFEVKIYKKVSGEREWMEIGSFFTVESPSNSKFKETFLIQADGRIKTTEPLYQTNEDGSRGVLSSMEIDLAASE